jgi:TIR domain
MQIDWHQAMTMGETATAETQQVFLSCHGQGRAAVEAVARALRERGIEPFLDRWYLAPGQPWHSALQLILGRSRAVAVFIGPQVTEDGQASQPVLGWLTNVDITKNLSSSPTS